MEETNQFQMDISVAKDIEDDNEEKKSIPVIEISRAITQLKLQKNELDADKNWQSNVSLWSQLAIELSNKLSIQNTPYIREYIYKVWHEKLSNVQASISADTYDKDTTTTTENDLSTEGDVVGAPMEPTSIEKKSKLSDSEINEFIRGDEALNRLKQYTEIANLQISYPTFEIKSALFKQKRYIVKNTCSLDSSLFLLYYIYKSKSNQYRSLFDRDIHSIKHLLETFDLIESENWNIGRLYWITTYNRNPKKNDNHLCYNLYDTADANVFQYVREVQLHNIISICESANCPKRVSQNQKSDIAMP